MKILLCFMLFTATPDWKALYFDGKKFTLKETENSRQVIDREQWESLIDQKVHGKTVRLVIQFDRRDFSTEKQEFFIEVKP